METEHSTSPASRASHDPFQELQGQVLMLTNICALLLATHPDGQALEQAIIHADIEGDGSNQPLIRGMENAQRMLSMLLNNHKQVFQQAARGTGKVQTGKTYVGGSPFAEKIYAGSSPFSKVDG